MNTNNPDCAQVECGLKTREKFLNVADQYHVNIPGYSGHLPSTALNDRGSRQITMMTTFGRDFSANAGFETEQTFKGKSAELVA